MKIEKPAVAFEAIKRRIPFDGLAHVGNCARNQRIDAASDQTVLDVGPVSQPVVTITAAATSNVANDRMHAFLRAEAEDAVRTLIRWAGDNPSRQGLLETPSRVVKNRRVPPAMPG